MEISNKMQAIPQSPQVKGSPLQKSALSSSEIKPKKGAIPTASEFDGTLAQATAAAQSAGAPTSQPALVAGIPAALIGNQSDGKDATKEGPENYSENGLKNGIKTGTIIGAKGVDVQASPVAAIAKSAQGLSGVAIEAPIMPEASAVAAKSVAGQVERKPALEETPNKSAASGSVEETSAAAGPSVLLGSTKTDTQMLGKPAASMNTGVKNTGLKPGMPGQLGQSGMNEWVFGGAASEPAQAALFSKPNTGTPIKRATQDFENLPSMRGADAAVAGSALSEMIAQILGANAQESEEGISDEQSPKRESPKLQAVPAGMAGLSGSEFLNARSGLGAQNVANAVEKEDSGRGMRNLTLIDGGQSSSLSELTAKPSLPGKSKILGSAEDMPEAQAGTQNFGTHISAGHGLGAADRAAMSTATAEVTGHVVKGAMSQDRLSSETLAGVTTSIRTMTAQGGGEMRIRMKPENLGEIHVRVMTSGKDVGLQIQASDESAKKIIEESIGSLKESLAGQNLTLGKIDVSVAQPASDRGSLSSQDNGQQPGHPAFGGLMGQDANQGKNGNGGWDGSAQDADSASGSGRSRASAISSMIAAGASRAGSSNQGASGRVDLMA